MDKPLVLDADALNSIAQNKLLVNLPKGCILTPHMKEFDRLFGNHQNWWERVDTARTHAQELEIFIILKNRYTFIVCPDEKVLINPTGSPKMATGGMGDVLAGMIVSFLAQGYNEEDAAILATYIHGYCGQEYDGRVCRAGELCKAIPGVMKMLAETA